MTAVGMAHLALGSVAAARADYAAAATFLGELLAIARALDYPFLVGRALYVLGDVARAQGDLAGAQARYRESLAAARKGGERSPITAPLRSYAGVSAARGQFERAARLFGALDAWLVREGQSLAQPRWGLITDFDRDLAAARMGLGERAFAAAWADGQAMTLEQAIAYALAEKGGGE
jgi:hypothetical protein